MTSIEQVLKERYVDIRKRIGPKAEPLADRKPIDLVEDGHRMNEAGIRLNITQIQARNQEREKRKATERKLANREAKAKERERKREWRKMSVPPWRDVVALVPNTNDYDLIAICVLSWFPGISLEDVRHEGRCMKHYVARLFIAKALFEIAGSDQSKVGRYLNRDRLTIAAMFKRERTIFNGK